ncbi:MAG: dbpA [Herbinix sp.]|jgi:superfamily II DNA/RNA helicase|nr:dbpA [Herbinix sp.]
MERTTFKDFKLSEEIRKALYYLGYEKPTKVQKAVIPEAMNRKDLIVKSQTGSGKTAAFAIPICELTDWLMNKPQALILTPTRELAIQVQEDFTNIGRLKRIKAVAVYGKQPIAIQKIELKQKTHVVIGTPGRVADLIERGDLVLDQIQFLILDEADEMLAMGFLTQVEGILNQLPKDRVTMLFSATMSDEIKKLALNHMRQIEEIEIQSDVVTVEETKHYKIHVSEEEKDTLLKAITVMESPDSCMIFCQTQERVEELFYLLKKQGYPCNRIHGGMEQQDRMKAMNSFKRGEFRYLIATNVAARGIDVESVSLVINYDIPHEKEGYVHRTGRTGRAGQEGRAITFVTKAQESYLKELEKFIGFEIPIMEKPTKEQILERQNEFEIKLKAKPVLKQSKSVRLDRQITKLRFNGGKNKKLRATNFVGVISNIEGVSAEDIGIITVLDSLTYVEILHGKGPKVLEAMKTLTIGGRQLKVTVAKDK